MTSDSVSPSLESENSTPTDLESANSPTETESSQTTEATEELSELPELKDDSKPGIDLQSQVQIKYEEEQLIITLPPADPSTSDDWSEVWEQFQHRLRGSDRIWQPGSTVHLMAKDRLVDGRQLQEIADALQEVQLNLSLVKTSRRQTAVAAAAAGYSVSQQAMLDSFASQYVTEGASSPLIEPLYWQSTIRSGMEIRHPGTVIVKGDLNPGGAVFAAGDIYVWGNLRGVVHAGADGNRKGLIMALRMEPTQLRVADVLARAPKAPPAQFEPEIAYVSSEGIRLRKAMNFFKTHSFSEEANYWIES